MAFSLGSLNAFTDQDELKMLVKTIYEPVSTQIITGAGGNPIVRGIKSAKALPILASTIYAQDGDNCGFTASGSTAITQRVLTVGHPMFQDSFCPKDLEAYFTQKGLSPGNPEDLGQFQTSIADEISSLIQEWVEIRIWQGDKDTTGEWDGFKTLLDDDNYTAAIKANATGGTYTEITSGTGITEANIDDILLQIQRKLPAKIRARSITKRDVVCFCGTDTFQKAIMNLAAANMYHYVPPEGQAWMWFPGTTFKLYGVPGLDGTSALVATRLDNMFIGTDLLNEEEQFEMWWSQDDRVMKYNVDFKYATQFAFLNEVTYWKLNS